MWWHYIFYILHPAPSRTLFVQEYSFPWSALDQAIPIRVDNLCHKKIPYMILPDRKRSGLTRGPTRYVFPPRTILINPCSSTLARIVESAASSEPKSSSFRRYPHSVHSQRYEVTPRYAG